jgi:hypothetical protein
VHTVLKEKHPTRSHKGFKDFDFEKFCSTVIPKPLFLITMINKLMVK